MTEQIDRRLGDDGLDARGNVFQPTERFGEANHGSGRKIFALNLTERLNFRHPGVRLEAGVADADNLPRRATRGGSNRRTKRRNQLRDDKQAV